MTDINIITHNGGFHADDVTAIAILRFIYPRMNLIRSRDKKLIDKADIKVDVGFEYDPEKGCFDHHQKGGARQYDDGKQMASAGIVWLEFGKQVIKKVLRDESITLTNEEIDDVFKNVASGFIRSIDLIDTGSCELPKEIYSLSQGIGLFNQTMIPGLRTVNQQDQNRSFIKASKHVAFLISQTILSAVSFIKSKAIVLKALERRDDELIILDLTVQWKKHVYEMDVAKKKKIIIYPGNNNSWMAQVIPIDPDSFDSYVKFPKHWCGYEGEELQKITGVKEAIFCHMAGFCMSAKSKDAIIQLCKTTLNQSD